MEVRYHEGTSYGTTSHDFLVEQTLPLSHNFEEQGTSADTVSECQIAMCEVSQWQPGVAVNSTLAWQAGVTDRVVSSILRVARLIQ